MSATNVPICSRQPVDLAIPFLKLFLDFSTVRGLAWDACPCEVAQEGEETGYVKAVTQFLGVLPDAHTEQHLLNGCLWHHDVFRARPFFQQVMADGPAKMPGADA